MDPKLKHYLKLTGLFIIATVATFYNEWESTLEFLSNDGAFVIIPIAFAILLIVMESKYPVGMQASKVTLNSLELVLSPRYSNSNRVTVVPYNKITNHKIRQGIRDRITRSYTLEIWFLDDMDNKEYANIGGLDKEEVYKIDDLLIQVRSTGELVGVVDETVVFGIDEQTEDMYRRSNELGKVKGLMQIFIGVIIGVALIIGFFLLLNIL